MSYDHYIQQHNSDEKRYALELLNFTGTTPHEFPSLFPWIFHLFLCAEIWVDCKGSKGRDFLAGSALHSS